MNNHLQKLIEKFLGFRTDCPYFGDLTRLRLNTAYSNYIQRAKKEYDPYDYETVQVGAINNDVICATLSKLMSYNPIRWGRENPFAFGIGAFINRPGNQNDIMAPIAEHLESYMSVNGWADKITGTLDAQLRISTNKYGNPNDNYNKLKALLGAAKIIANQNRDDFRDKDGPYRATILKRLSEICPGRFDLEKFGLVDEVKHIGTQKYKLDSEFAALIAKNIKNKNEINQLNEDVLALHTSYQTERQTDPSGAAETLESIKDKQQETEVLQKIISKIDSEMVDIKKSIAYPRAPYMAR